MTKPTKLLTCILLFFILAGNAQNETNKPFFLQQKSQLGIDFYAVGNEPNWSLNMDFEKEFKFKNLEGLEIITPAEKGIKAMDTNVTRYRSLNETYELIIQVIQQDCSDTMSDNIYYYKVTIDYKKVEDKDYTRLSGCGNFIPDYRLHNIWAIETLENKNLKDINFTKGQPYIEIDLVKNRISGHDGCNNIMGSLRYEKDYLIFGNLAGTMMACPNMEISNEIPEILSNKKIAYEYKEGKLYFVYRGKTIMVLKNID